jgi:hypothetical protein
MPLNPSNVKRAEEAAQRLQLRLNSLTERPGMTPDHPEYQSTSDYLNRAHRAIDEYYAGQRQTDDSGKLTAPPATRLPASTGEAGKDTSGYNYHFEPSVSEVQNMLRSDPQLVAQLGLTEWAGGIATPARTDQVADPDSGRVSGQNEVPAQTYLDTMDSSSSAYKRVADRVWERRMQEAKARGENLQRYRDVHLKDQPVDFLAGGAEYNIDRRLAPATLGAANAWSAGQAAPLYDAAVDLTDYLGSRQDPNEGQPEPVADPTTGQVIGENIHRAPGGTDLPHSNEVISRSPLSYLAGNFGAYGMPGNPTNLMQEGLEHVIGSRLNGALGNELGSAATSAIVGGGINTVEGGVQDFSDALGSGQGVGDAALSAAKNMPLNAAFGAGGGAVFDAAGQTFGGMRKAYRGRVDDLRHLENAGGGTHLLKGVVPPPEVQGFVDQSNAPRAVGSPVAYAAEEVAPHIQQGLEARGAAERQNIEQRTQEYFDHPAYNQQRESAQPAIQGLVELAQQGWTQGRLSGAPMNVNNPRVARIGKIIGEFSEHKVVPTAEAGAIAAQHGGVVVDGQLGARLLNLDPELAPKPGQSLVLVPFDLDARTLTTLEERIDEELNSASNKGQENDPVWQRVNREVKQLRDKFPYYVDDSGNLIPPPASEPMPQPYGPADDLPQGPSGASALPKPVPIEPQRNVPLEAQPGVGPGQPDLPSNPFDPRLPVSRERVNPEAPVNVSGPPRTIEPEAQPGVGPQYQPRRTAAQQQEPFDGGVHPRKTVEVKGEPAKPPVVTAERQPITERGIQREPQGPSREVAPEEATPLSLLSGNKLAMEAPREPTERMVRPERADEMPARPNSLAEAIRSAAGPSGLADVPSIVRALGGDVKAAHQLLLDADAAGAIELRPEGGLNRFSKEDLALAIPGPHQTHLTQARVTDPEMLERMARDQSLPAPTAKEWTAATKESGNYVEDLLGPGRDPRSGEAKRMSDLTEQQKALEEATGQLRNLEDRLGPMDEGEREKNLIRLISNKLGREVTKEELVKAGLLAGGVGAMALSDEDDKDKGAVAAAAGVMLPGGQRAVRRTGAQVLNELRGFEATGSKGFRRLVDDLSFVGNIPRPGDGTLRDIASLAKNSQLTDLERSHVERVLGLPETPSPASERVNSIQRANTFVSGASEKLKAQGHEVQRGVDMSLKKMFGDKPDMESIAKAWDLTPLKAIGDRDVKSVVSPYGSNGVVMRAVGYDHASTNKATPAWRMERVIKKVNGELVADHQMFRLREDLQGKAVGEKVLREQMAAYAKMGVDKVQISHAAWVGRYYWPSIGFDNQAAVPEALSAYKDFLVHKKGLSEQEAFDQLEGIRSLPSLANAEHGKEFFLSQDGEWNHNLTLSTKEENPYYQFMKKRLDMMIGAGVGLYGALDNDDSNDDATAAAGVLIGGGRKGIKKGKQLEAILSDGTKVEGFSALRHQQHEALTSLEKAKQRVGAGGDKTIRDRVIGFNQGNDKLYDEALLEEAKKAGKENELYNAAAASVYPGLRKKAMLGGNEGVLNKAVDFVGLRADKGLELLSGAERNPFAREPNTPLGKIQRAMLEDPARRLLNTRGGRGGARYGDDFRRIYEQLFPDNPPDEEQSDERR